MVHLGSHSDIGFNTLLIVCIIKIRLIIQKWPLHENLEHSVELLSWMLYLMM